MNLLRNLDQQGYEFVLSVNNNRTYKTAFGGFLILILSVIIIMSFIAFGRDLITREGPTVYSANTKLNNPTFNKDSFKSFKMAAALMYGGGFRIPDVDKMINLNSSLIITDPSRPLTTEFKLYNADTCLGRNNYTDLQKDELKESFIGEKDTYKCLNESLEFDIAGTFGDPKFVVWGFEVIRCVNSTENNNSCFSKEIIESKLKEFYIHLIFEGYYIDSNDYENPVKFNYNKKIIRLGIFSSRIDIIYLRPFEYISDNGFLLNDKNYYKGFDVVNHERESIFDPDSKLLYRVKFTLDNLNTNVYRVYIKIQKVAADIGGIIKFFSLILSIIGKTYSELRFYDYFVNNFIYKHKTTSKNEDKQMVHSTLNNFSTNNNINNIKLKQNYIALNHASTDNKKDQSKNGSLDSSNNNLNNLNNLKIFNNQKDSKGIDNNQSFDMESIDQVQKLISNYVFEYLSLIKIHFNCCHNKNIKYMLKMKATLLSYLSAESLLEKSEKLNIISESICEKLKLDEKTIEECCEKRTLLRFLKN